MIDFLQRSWGLPPFLGLLLWPILWLFSKLYAVIIHFRNCRYDIRQPWRAECKTIALGNISAGGTGKTPVGLAMAQYFSQRGWKVAIVLRGYAKKDGLADEVELYRNALGQEAVFVGAQRQKSLESLTQQGYQLAILDDAFQHRKVFRDINLLLMDITQPPWLDNLLPLGFLREPCHSLRRANAVLLTRTEQVAPAVAQQAREKIASYSASAPIFSLATIAKGIAALGGQVDASRSLCGAYFLMSAIGQPENFKHTAMAYGVTVLGQHWFPDHHHFTDKEQKEALTAAQNLGAQGVLITAKDAVKWSIPGKVFVLHIEAQLPQELWEYLETMLQKNHNIS